MLNFLFTLINYTSLFLIEVSASNPEINYPDYVIEITENVYVTVTDVETIQSLEYTTSYSTNTVSTVDTAYHDITKYHTKTETHIKRTHTYTTELYTSCITEIQNTYISHISTEIVTSNVINTSLIHSTLFSTISDQVTTTSYQSVKVIEIVKEHDTTTETIPIKFCTATIIPKNLEELTSALIEFNKQQEEEMKYFLNGANQPIVEEMNVGEFQTTTFYPFDWNQFSSISTTLTPADIALFQYQTLQNLFIYQQKSLQLLAEGQSSAMLYFIFQDWINENLNSFDIFLKNYTPADYPQKYDDLKELYLIYLQKELIKYYLYVNDTPWANDMIQLLFYQTEQFVSFLRMNNWIID